MSKSSRFVRLFALLAVLGLVATACGGESSSTDESTNTEETAESTDSGESVLRVAVEAEADGFNPTSNRFTNSNFVMAGPVFDNLVYYDPDGNWFPFLATSFEAVDDANMSWQMTLPEGVLFHDGSELDAADVVATVGGQLADQTIGLVLRYRYDLENPIEAIDDYTVQFNLTRSESNFPETLGGQLGMIVPSEWLAAVEENPEMAQMPPGTGPYMIDSRIQDEVTVLVPFEDYWAADQVEFSLDRIELYPITDPVVAAERILAGDLDLVTSSNIDALLTLRDAADEGIQTIENKTASEDFMMLNTARAPFDDIRVRQAITHATPQEAYVSLIRQGVADRADSMFHPDLPYNNPDVVQETDMPELAGPLVAAYCADEPDNCTDGKVDIELQHSGPSTVQTRIADLLIDGWSDYFNVTVDEKLQDDHVLEVILGAFDAVTFRQFEEPAPENDLLWLDCNTIDFTSLNFPRYCNPERQALIDEIVATNDEARDIELWQELQVEVQQSYTYVFFNHAVWNIGAGANIEGICGQTAPNGTEMMCNNQGRVRLRSITVN